MANWHELSCQLSADICDSLLKFALLHDVKIYSSSVPGIMSQPQDDPTQEDDLIGPCLSSLVISEW